MSNLEGLLEVTRILIEEEGTSIKIRRLPPKTRQPDGSMKRETDEPVTLPAQRLFFSGTTADDEVRETIGGTQVVANFIIVGLPDADFDKGDSFEKWDRTFKVLKVHSDLRWQRKAWCYSING